MSTTADTSKPTVAGSAGNRPKSTAPNWNDPKVHAGDSPPLPRWPLIVSAAAWIAWVLFLLAMMWMRVNTTPV